jgi:mono/diheme cytochrome c family protein
LVQTREPNLWFEKGDFMKRHFKSVGLLLIAIITLLLLVLSAETLENQKSKVKPQRPSKTTPQVAQGRYLVMMSGCNDCHTRGYMQLEAKVPETDWLTGESVGWHGPWGTTYPINLRLFMQYLSEDAWIKFSRAAKSRPAMPSWVLHEMRDEDLRAIYYFIKSLGPKGENAPAYLPPNQKPKAPYFDFVPQAAK